MTDLVHAIDTGHADMVHDTQLDYYGRRMATCSSDRSVRVYGIGGAAGTVLEAELHGYGRWGRWALGA